MQRTYFADPERRYSKSVRPLVRLANGLVVSEHTLFGEEHKVKKSK